MSSTNENKVLPREEMQNSVCWDLSKLYKNDEEWEQDLKKLEDIIEKIGAFKNTLGNSPETLKECLEFNNSLGLLEERLGYYAQLRTAEDGANSESQGRMARFVNVASRCQTAKSYQVPEIQAIPDTTMEEFLASEQLAEFRIVLHKILRFKPHVLSEKEERLLSMQAEFSQTAVKAFSSLTDVDMKFGELDTPDGKKELTQSTYGAFMLSTSRELRCNAYTQFLKEFDEHKHTLTNLYTGSVQHDIYGSRVRNFTSCIESALFPDEVPLEVYDNLIESVHNNLKPLHRYYAIRAKALKVDKLRIYDTRVPLVADIKMEHTYDQAVNMVIDSLHPLGEEYTTILKKGLLGSWVDRYENKGKRSGAFSAGSYVGDPYILMNYKDEVFNDVFTLTHEAGHSMHSMYSVQNNPFQHYNYTIFVAEVASTFNEQLLTNFLLNKAEDKQFKAYLVNKQIDDIIGTIYRQTMFAEFEKRTHEMSEKNIPLTIDSLRSEYRTLLEQYFGPGVALEEFSDLEGLRIPHFYHSFYVYKYATGLSAAIALSQQVLEGGESERIQYLDFLKSGGSQYPLDQLKEAGVNMTTPAPVNAALKNFSSLLDQLENLLQL